MNKPNIINIANIPLHDYEGYLWYADQEIPKYIGVGQKTATFTADLLSDFPFVVEGALYCKQHKISISIRWAASGYVITQFDGNLLDTHKEAYQYICHTWFVAKDKAKRVNIREVWTLETDECTKDECKKDQCKCLNWPSFRPSFSIFQGFVPA